MHLFLKSGDVIVGNSATAPVFDGINLEWTNIGETVINRMSNVTTIDQPTAVWSYATMKTLEKRWSGSVVEDNPAYVPYLEPAADPWEGKTEFSVARVIYTIKKVFAPGHVAKLNAFKGHWCHDAMKGAINNKIDPQDPATRTMLDDGLADLVADDAQWSQADVDALIAAMPDT